MFTQSWGRKKDQMRKLLLSNLTKYDVPITQRCVTVQSTTATTKDAQADKADQAAKKPVDQTAKDLKSAEEAITAFFAEGETSAPVAEPEPNPKPKAAKPNPKPKAAKPKSNTRQRDVLDTTAIVEGKRDRKKTKKDGEEEEAQDMEKAADAPVLQKAKRVRRCSPGGYNTAAKNTEKMFSTLLSALSKQADGVNDDVMSALKELPPAKGQPKATPPAAESSSSTSADASLIKFLQDQVVTLQASLAEKDALLAKKDADITRLQAEVLTQYKAGVRDMKNIPGTPNKT